MSPLSPQEFSSDITAQAKLEPYHASRIATGIRYSDPTDIVPIHADSVVAMLPRVVYALEHGEHSANPDALRAQVTVQIESLFSEDWRLQTLGKHVFRYFELLEKFVSRDRLQEWLGMYIDRIMENKQYGGANQFRYFAALNLDRLQSIFADDPEFLARISSFIGDEHWIVASAVVSQESMPDAIAPQRDLVEDEQFALPNIRTARGVQHAATVCSPQAEAYHNQTSLSTHNVRAQDRKYVVVNGKLVGSVKWGSTRETVQHSFLSFRTVQDEGTGTYPLIENALYLASSDVLRRIRETAGNVVHFSSEDDVAFMPQRSMEDSAIWNTNYLRRVRTVREIVEHEFGFSG